MPVEFQERESRDRSMHLEVEAHLRNQRKDSSGVSLKTALGHDVPCTATHIRSGVTHFLEEMERAILEESHALRECPTRARQIMSPPGGLTPLPRFIVWIRRRSTDL